MLTTRFLPDFSHCFSLLLKSSLFIVSCNNVFIYPNIILALVNLKFSFVTIFENISKLITSHYMYTVQLLYFSCPCFKRIIIAAHFWRLILPLILLRILLPGYTGFNPFYRTNWARPPVPEPYIPFHSRLLFAYGSSQLQYVNTMVSSSSGADTVWGEGGRSGNNNSGANATSSFVEYRNVRADTNGVVEVSGSRMLL